MSSFTIKSAEAQLFIMIHNYIFYVVINTFVNANCKEIQVIPSIVTMGQSASLEGCRKEKNKQWLQKRKIFIK